MDFARRAVFFPEQTTPFETGLLSCGHELVRSPEYRWDGMHRGSQVLYVWQYTLAGRGAIRLNGTTYPLGPGTAFFVRIPHEHVYYLPGDSDSWEFLYLTLCGAETDRLGAEFIRRYGNVLTHELSSRTVTLAKTILHESETGFSAERAILGTYEFLLTLYRERQPQEEIVPSRLLLDAVNRYLRSRLSEPVRIRDLARICGCSRSHFTRQFHAAAGMTPQQYLQEMRMRFALRLLQTERKSIKETAMDAGFSDPSYFCRVFRRCYGMTPEEFRSGKPPRLSAELMPCGAPD